MLLSEGSEVIKNQRALLSFYNEVQPMTREIFNGIQFGSRERFGLYLSVWQNEGQVVVLLWCFYFGPANEIRIQR